MAARSECDRREAARYLGVHLAFFVASRAVAALAGCVLLLGTPHAPAARASRTRN